MARVRNSAQVAEREVTKAKRTTALRGKETTTMAAAAKVDVNKPLTDKQKAYVVARASGESVPAAMALAGYNEQPSYGYRMEKMPNILAALREERARYAEAAQVSRLDVINMHKEAFELARLMAEPASMVSAAREIGKICGHYETNINVNISGTVQHEVHRFEQMTDEELLRFLSEQGAASQALAAPQAQDQGEELEPNEDEV